MKKSDNRGVDRRKFLKAAAAAGGMATLVGNGAAVRAQQSLAAQPAKAPAVPPREADPPSGVDVSTAWPSPVQTSWSMSSRLSASSTLPRIPARVFAGYTNRLINYGGNKNPEFITCCHEESSVHMAQGYAQVEGKPMLVLAHSTVGLQHASMGIYDAWAAGRQFSS